MTIDPHQLWTAKFNKKMRGYSPADVDVFLHSIADRLAAGERPQPDEITDARFELALRGYDADEVDAFLSDLRLSLEQS